MRRVLFFWLAVCAAGALSGAQDLAKRPNVVFIISDDLTAEALSCYGNRQCRTPNIDALASRGVRFTRAYTQFPVCGPSRAALMSGMYPQVIGVLGNGMSKRFTGRIGARPSMSELFKRSGYYTARVSKIYHMRVPGDITAGVDGPDHLASWTERFNCQAPEWMTKGEHEHLTNEKLRRMPRKHYGLGFGGAFYVVKGASDGREQPDQMAAAKAVELIGKHKEKPFFLAVGFVRPHVPLVAPASFFRPYPEKDMRLAPKMEGDWDDIPGPGITKSSRSSGLEGALDKQRRVLCAYYASVAYMDAQVGKVLRAIDEHGLRERTIVVFTSDHGYHLGEHDFWQKMSLHEESTRIPLIVSAPGHAPGTRQALAEQIDIYPTLASLAGLSIPEHCQGESLVPVMKDREARVRDAAYCVKGQGRGHLLRTERHAYIKYKDGSAELYDMEQDPRQYTNLADKVEFQELRDSLQARLDARLEEIGGSR